MGKKLLLPWLIVVAIAALSAVGSAQATWNSANIPQPHLAKARALAAEENSWRLIGLVTCYPNDGHRRKE